jgi:hypothetical protein
MNFSTVVLAAPRSDLSSGRTACDRVVSDETGWRMVGYPSTEGHRVRLNGTGQPDNKFSSTTVSYNRPRRSGVGFRCDF